MSFLAATRPFGNSEWPGRWRPPWGDSPAGYLRCSLGGGEKGRRSAQLLRSRASLAERLDVLRSYWSRHWLEKLGVDGSASLATWRPMDASTLGSATSLLELGGYMQSMLLRDADERSMAHGLELRVPFLDHRLATWSLEVNAASARRPKGHLIDACGELLPEGIADRPKQGFELPMDAWMRGPLQRIVQHGLESAGGWIGREAALHEAESAWRAGRLRWTRIWLLVVLGHWLENEVG